MLKLESQRVRRNYYSITFGLDFSNGFRIATLVLALSQTSGGFGLAIWALLTELFFEGVGEVVTGHFADLFGRRLTILIGCFLVFLGGIAILVTSLVTTPSEQYFFAALSAFFFMMGITCCSGATDAWVVDTIDNIEGSTQSHHEIFGSKSIVTHLGISGGGATSLLLLFLTGKQWMPWLVLTAVTFVLWVWSISAIIEKGFVRSPLREIWKNSKSGFRNLLKCSPVWYLSTGIGLQYCIGMMLSCCWIAIATDYFLKANLPMHQISFIIISFWFLSAGSRIGGAYLGRKMLRKRKESVPLILPALAFVQLLPVVLFLGLRKFWFTPYQVDYLTIGLVFCCVYMVQKYLEISCNPMVINGINDAAKSSFRALAFSMLGAVGNTIIILSFTIFYFWQGRLPANPDELFYYISFALFPGIFLTPFLYHLGTKSR